MCIGAEINFDIYWPLNERHTITLAHNITALLHLMSSHIKSTARQRDETMFSLDWPATGLTSLVIAYNFGVECVIYLFAKRLLWITRTHLSQNMTLTDKDIYCLQLKLSPNWEKSMKIQNSTKVEYIMIRGFLVSIRIDSDHQNLHQSYYSQFEYTILFQLCQHEVIKMVWHSVVITVALVIWMWIRK